jgi:hypothetical protein
MPMRQVASCVYNRLQQRPGGDDQSREKENRMDSNAQPDCESHQQSRRRWFQNCQDYFFHNASFVD